MANITYPAGIATAYGAAVRGGYTGTYEDFCRQQAQYAESAAAVEQAKEDAEAAANAAEGNKTAAAGSASAADASAGQASTSATNAANSATAANASKIAAATSATEAENSATAAAGSASDAQTSADDAQASAEAAAQSAASVDVHTDGNYPEMTVGTSEQLLSTQYAVNKTPYLYRTTGGSSNVGNREYVRGITGGTVAWNQLLHADVRERTISGITYTMNADGSITVSGTATESAPFSLELVPLIGGHVYYLSGCPSGGGLGKWALYGNATEPQLFDSGSGSIKKQASNTTGNFYIIVYIGMTVDLTFKPQLFDLTQMFGTAIADYIYSLEQANAGAGVAWFKKLFPNDYYPYNAGELKSVEGVSAHEMVGFNQWDEEWEVGTINWSTGTNDTSSARIRSKNYTRIFPSTAYNFYFGGKDGDVHYYDINKTHISAQYLPRGGSMVDTSPSNAYYVRFTPNTTYGATYNNDICINLSWSGTHNGEYKPYEKHSYPLDSSLTLRGIPKLDASNNLYYDGDEYAPDGTVTRKYGIVDLGTLDYSKLNDTNTFYASPVGMKKFTRNIEVMGYDYVNSSIVSQFTKNEYTTNAGAGQSIWFTNDSYATAADIKAAMSGVLCVYEKATPTTETAEPYNEVQICDDWGTEEYVSTSIVPVGHTTDYPANLRDKLQHLPDLASADGNYIVSQSGTQMTLAPLPIVIPAPPTTDGTYTFRATVSNGVPTLSWVAE